MQNQTFCDVYFGPENLNLKPAGASMVLHIILFRHQ